MDEELLERDIHALELEKSILYEILVELGEDWFSPKFDHIWAKQTKLFFENIQGDPDDE